MKVGYLSRCNMIRVNDGKGYQYGKDSYEVLMSALKEVDINTGNLAFANAIQTLFECDFLPINDITEEIVSKYERFITDAFIFIQENEDMSWFIKINEMVGEKPIIPISIGLQSAEDKIDFVFHNSVIELLKDMSQRAILGVRGNYTAEVLRRNGIRNIDVIGCPSMYVTPTLRIEGKVQSKLRTIANFRTLSNKANNERDITILNYFANHTEAFVEQTMCYFSSDVKQGSMKRFMEYYKENNKIFFDIGEWKNHLKQFDFSIGARFHGNVLAIRAGVPALFLTCDSRTRELTEYYQLPAVPLENFDSSRTIEDYYKQADYQRFNKTFSHIYNHFLEFCKKNSLVIKEKNERYDTNGLQNNMKEVKCMTNYSREKKELYLLADIVAKNVNGRKIVIWGDNNELKEVLQKEFNLGVSFVVTVLRNIIDGKWIRDLTEIKGKSKEYYIIAFGREYEEKYDKLLKDYGYNEVTDFVYRKIKPIVIENWDTAKRYEDIYGNVIEGNGGTLKKVIFRGYNNRIRVEEHVSGLQNMEFDCCANHEVLLREGCRFNAAIYFKLNGFQGYSQTIFEKGCRFSSTKVVVYGHAAGTKIVVGENSTFEENLELHSNTGKKVIIGRDCMFSHDILLQAGDGHSIFDVETGQNVNSIYERLSDIKNQLYIGEHVWVGAKAFILSGTSIRSGSIIGGNSTVKGVFPNNCVVAGNPAKIVKKDVAWSRDNCAISMASCGGNDYTIKTNDAKPPLLGKNVLVIGGTRLMGIHLVKELLANGNEVTIATRGKTLDNFGEAVHRIVVDITDALSVKQALEGRVYDVVFDNLAFCSNNVKRVLSVLKCERYVQMSSLAVYKMRKLDLNEMDFKPQDETLNWCESSGNYVDRGYAEGKRQAEIALYKEFSNISAVSVRVPYVTKTDRLYFYCKCMLNDVPMKIADVNRALAFVRETEVGKFLAWIASQDCQGTYNLASEGVITIKSIFDYIEKKTGKKAIVDNQDGVLTPFNEESFSLDLGKVKQIGYTVSNHDEWFWKLMDEYITRAITEKQKNNSIVSTTTCENSISVVDKSKCTGCGACMNICLKGAITMHVDEEGFCYPELECQKCVNCGLCQNVCSTFGKVNLKKKEKQCYALIADDETRAISSSGGAFSLLAEKILEQGGVVCGAAWSEGYNVEHVFVTSKDELYRLRGSKYVQSDTKLTYKQTKEFLQQGRMVLYTGMPCQIEGLLLYLQKDYDNLITIDLLCRGIASNELFKTFLEQNYKGKEIKNIKFKDKKPLGWGATTSYEFSDGTIEKTNIKNSIWMCAYLENIMDRKSCYSCKFNSRERVGDISIGDFWGIDKHDAKLNDGKGTSIVITSSKKGDKLVQSVKSQCKMLERVPLEKGVPYNSALCQHVKWTDKRPKFFELMKKLPFPAALDRVFYGEKYKVGIVGWWSNLNYGGTLTYYALNQAIQNMGYSVLMIRRSSSNPHMPHDNTVPMKFAKKHYNISRLYTTRDMHWLNYSCHAFISGSDQLWNPYLEEYAGPEFFLSFVNEHNLKISYASSFGNISSVSETFKNKYRPLLERFDGISVREDYAEDICKNEFGLDALHVCDPVFLCNVRTYEMLANDSNLELPEEYVLNFLLDPNEEKVAAYRYVKEKIGIKNVVNFTDLQNTDSKDFGGDSVYKSADIEDFVKAYRNAKFIITDSFHGTCFAIIFNKPFISIANYSRGERRFISLLNWLGLSNRLVLDVKQVYDRNDLFEPIDYNTVNEVIERKRKDGLTWLQKLLEKMI